MRRARFGVIFAGALIASAQGASAPALRELIWLDTAGRTPSALTREPGECYERPQNDALAAETGRALFASPTLLGGPAARTGLSCTACHTNGRANRHFLLPELTNIAGAADVTSEWASRMRGDGIMNPRPIPDLAGVHTRPQFGSAGETSLERFTLGVIVEEFQGAPPPPAAFAGLIAYLRALDQDACPSRDQAVTLATRADDVRRAFDAALGQAQAGERETSALTLAATQDRLGLIVERLPPRAFGAERRALDGLARQLGAARQRPETLATLAPAWRARFDATMRMLARRERQTWFNQDQLARDLISDAP